MRKYIKRKYIPIIKYNPAYRDKEGTYIKNEWTSYSEIGNSFDGEIFTLKKYLEVEEKYVEAFFMVKSFFHTKSIEIIHVFKHSEDLSASDFSDDSLFKTYKNINIGDVIYSEDVLSNIIILALREYFEVELLVDRRSRSEILFGFDYYMYLKTNIDVDLLLNEISEIGLYTSI
ncbi:hypothetical protein [Aequorivita antarctica]|uniref:Uncharacterized protein n=1 Tax=Aequorivita antarctica TaxID=153266 RepID=A0A5C6YZE6_9FLAO|nr:hypothetical protein [Aequorivita antarctica]TXD72797.1 hypothetical protein ESU54_11310 [Aequorivita antarctica]SRX75231.1 hypothetical protein AEQU3_02225 [Aequorivita antarctica]